MERRNFDDCLAGIVTEIRKLPRSSMQSGVDSHYKDVWEEYATQIQVEESMFFKLYDDLVEAACYKLVSELANSNVEDLWRESAEYIGNDEYEIRLEPDEMRDAVTRELKQRVVNAAANYELSLDVEADENEEYCDEEEREEVLERFELKKRDCDAIQVAKNVIRLFLCQGDLSARQVVGFGKALYALEQLPEITPGIYCCYGICYRSGDEKYSEMRYITFLISEEEFEISTGGSVYDQSVGGDSISGPGWRIEIGGFADRSLGQELYEMEDTIREYLSLGAEITVEDSSDEIVMEDGE